MSPAGGERLHLTGILERARATCPRSLPAASLLRDLSGGISPPPSSCGEARQAISRRPCVCPSIPRVFRDTRGSREERRVVTEHARVSRLRAISRGLVLNIRLRLGFASVKLDAVVVAAEILLGK